MKLHRDIGRLTWSSPSGSQRSPLVVVVVAGPFSFLVDGRPLTFPRVDKLQRISHPAGTCHSLQSTTRGGCSHSLVTSARRVLRALKWSASRIPPTESQCWSVRPCLVVIQLFCSAAHVALQRAPPQEEQLIWYLAQGYRGGSCWTLCSAKRALPAGGWGCRGTAAISTFSVMSCPSVPCSSCTYPYHWKLPLASLLCSPTRHAATLSRSLLLRQASHCKHRRLCFPALSLRFPFPLHLPASPVTDLIKAGGTFFSFFPSTFWGLLWGQQEPATSRLSLAFSNPRTNGNTSNDATESNTTSLLACIDQLHRLLYLLYPHTARGRTQSCEPPPRSSSVRHRAARKAACLFSRSCSSNTRPNPSRTQPYTPTLPTTRLGTLPSQANPPTCLGYFERCTTG